MDPLFILFLFCWHYQGISCSFYCCSVITYSTSTTLLRDWSHNYHTTKFTRPCFNLVVLWDNPEHPGIFLLCVMEKGAQPKYFHKMPSKCQRSTCGLQTDSNGTKVMDLESKKKLLRDSCQSQNIQEERKTQTSQKCHIQWLPFLFFLPVFFLFSLSLFVC